VKPGTVLQLRPRAETGPRIDAMSDAGLVAACAAGDRTARAMLFEQHVDAIHRFVARMRGSDADAVDDLVQATFLRAFGAAARFRGPTARAWLHGIAANTVKEHARSEIRRKRALGAFTETLAATTGPIDPLVARLPDAIAALPHAQRAAFVLIDLEGERGVEAAAALGIPQGTLWRHVSEARIALRRSLGGEP
jgi:RNA polymerase sigma-70 factor (ECF subfamily)